MFFFFFKQKTAYEMRISDWSSDVCSSDLPGSQNIALFEALRKSSLRTVVPAHELAAAFMAIGFSRASGKVGVITTIPGPGLTYAITGLAEARLDSVPLLCLVQCAAKAPGKRFHQNGRASCRERGGQCV